MFDLAPGTVIADRYRVGHEIGKGGYGTVYRAQRVADGCDVALKMLHTRHVYNEVHVKRFSREAALVTRLQHKNVVTMLDYGHMPDGVPFIVFELLVGQSLKQALLERGALSIWRCGQIAIQTLRALAAAHALEIAHRDIKPGNIYLCDGRDDDFVKVLDFGVAKAIADERTGATKLTKPGQMVGSPAFMSPEQIRSDFIGFSCDLYSLGLVMGEALSGQRIVNAEKQLDIFKAHLAPAKHHLPEEVWRSGLGTVIARAIEKDPEHRYAQAVAMLADVEAALHAEYERQEARSRPITAPMSQQAALGQLQETVRMADAENVDDILRRYGVDPATGKRAESASLAGLESTVAISNHVTTTQDGSPKSRADGLEATVPQRPVGIDALLAAAASRDEGEITAPMDQDPRQTTARKPIQWLVIVLAVVVLSAAIGVAYAVFG